MKASKVAFVMGGANTLDADHEAAQELCPLPDTRIFTNHAGRDYPFQVEHYVTLHPELMPGWIDERREKRYPDPDNLWTSNKKDLPAGLKWNHVDRWEGSSGLLAVTVALHLGYDKVILCGVPLDRQMRHYDSEELWQEAHKYRAGWVKHLPKMQGKVKSFSGWTSRLLGAPTREWLND